MAVSQENTVKRMATDILVAAIHSGRLHPPHYTAHEELINAQVKLFDEAYQQLAEAIKNTKVKEVSSKRAATDALIAFLHNGRFHPAQHLSEEDKPREQIRMLVEAFEKLAESFKASKDE